MQKGMTRGAKIRKKRKELDMIQGQLAAMCGTNISRISRIELGRVEKPHRELLERIAKCLGLNLGELIGYKKLLQDICGNLTEDQAKEILEFMTTKNIISKE